jgi:hypothetical protein
MSSRERIHAKLLKVLDNTHANYEKQLATAVARYKAVRGDGGPSEANAGTNVLRIRNDMDYILKLHDVVSGASPTAYDGLGEHSMSSSALAEILGYDEA